MTKEPSFSYKHIVSGAAALIAGMFVVLAVAISLLGAGGVLVDNLFWTLLAIFFGFELILASMIESMVVPRMNKGGLPRTLLVYYAVGAFVIVLIAFLIYFLNFQSAEVAAEVAFVIFIFAFYSYLFYALSVTLARIFYPLIHRGVWREALPGATNKR